MPVLDWHKRNRIAEPQGHKHRCPHIEQERHVLKLSKVRTLTWEICRKVNLELTDNGEVDETVFSKPVATPNSHTATVGESASKDNDRILYGVESCS